MSEVRDAPASLFDRTLESLGAAWRDVAQTAIDVIYRSPRADLSGPEDLERLRQQMQACLERRGGEVSARARAARLGHTYLDLDHTGRERFLALLAGEFDCTPAVVADAIAARESAGSETERRAAEAALRRALEPPRRRLLMQFNALQQGVKFLVDLRAELIGIREMSPALAALEEDLRQLLVAWFDVGFLEMRRIDWHASASLLEKLIAYEAVHAIRSWEDLKNRLDSDRRCFAFFHPNMPDEPLIFVEVALVGAMAASIDELLDESAPVTEPGTARVAIFYSISNAQRGLAGISLGNFLIKRVVDALSAEIPELRTFATLSPVPGLLRWIRDGSVPVGLTPAERKALQRALAAVGAGEGDGEPDDRALIIRALAHPGWTADETLAASLEGPMTRLAARYLLAQRDGRGRALDGVAHFHLSNGARIERLNWLADRSDRGLGQSAGIMVNYLYRLSDIESNHEAYRGEGKTSASSSVRSLARS